MDKEILQSFMQENCLLCGSQRCDPSDSIFRNGCKKWRNFIKQFEDEEINIFISQPMSGLSSEEILARRHEIMESAQKYFKDKQLFFIDSFNPDTLNQGSPIEELGECIKLLQDANFVIMAKNLEKSKGCKVEHLTAKVYNIPIIYEV